MPPAEHDVDERLVRALLGQLPSRLAHLRDLPVEHVAEGWDNSVWRVGDKLAARVSRRALAAALLENEARWTEAAAAPLVALGIPVTTPVHLTPAGELHPLPWLLTTWVDGDLLDDLPVAQRAGAAARLADALPRLHRPAPGDAPHNPFRGPPISELPPPRAEVVARARAQLGDAAAADLLALVERGRSAPPWPGSPQWVHGDLHPLNLVVGSQGLGILDFGDLTAADPAVDLGVLWTAFDARQRAAARRRLEPSYDEHVWDRARAWAARLVLGVAGDDAHRFEHTVRHAIAQLAG